MKYIVSVTEFFLEDYYLYTDIKQFDSEDAARDFFKQECEQLKNDLLGVELFDDKSDYYNVEGRAYSDIAKFNRIAGSKSIYSKVELVAIS
jgi:hypothetical protein